MSGNPHASAKTGRIQNFGKFMKSIDIENFNVTFDELTNSPSAASVVSEGISRALQRYLKFIRELRRLSMTKKLKI